MKFAILPFSRGPISRRAEVDCIGVLVHPVGTIGIPDTHITIIDAQDVIAVRPAVHPPGEGLAGGGAVTAVDVFPTPSANVPGGNHPLPGS